MQAEMGIDAKLLLEEVTCIDYSDIVIQRLNGQSLNGKESHLSNDSSALKKPEIIKPTYQAMDARSLPFSSNMYDLILEKGTLDAMLSDEEEGLSNCIKIVKEMARVTSEGGAILIVSHLNANEPKGMAWLEDVVFCGLKIDFLERRKSKRDRAKASRCESSDEKKNTETSETVNDYDDKEYVWSVEVHGGDGQYLDENGDEMEDADENAVLVYGPAVYIIKKMSVPAAIANELFGKKKVRQTKEDFSEEVELVEMPPVKLTFMTY
jgi:SAM-dependent methyltransferase